MGAKKKVYVETSVISNLTARPSPRLVEAGRQVVTIEWWERATSEYELFGSFVVEREASNGDPDAAARRMEKVRQLKPTIIRKTCERLGYACLEICTPDEL